MTDPLHSLRTSLADRYRIERELGHGGMATVYLAHDLRHERKVALKVLRPELAAAIGAERFLSEIKTTANLQHPHILALFDSGGVNGTVFYVMPFVEGESLRDRLDREKQLPIDEAVRIATEVADALQYAHGHGVIHRDIKPENILLHGGHAMVADFGIALAASATAGTRMTETGMSLGTPTYMSPEQAMGERTLDARTDIYALGCVLYEMLAGDPPFMGSTAQAIVAKVMTEKPAGIVARRDRVPQPVEDAVLSALEKLPADRPATAAAFVEMLRAPATPTRRQAGGQKLTWLQRNAVIVTASLIVIAAAAVGAVLWRGPSAPETGTIRFSVAMEASQRPNTNGVGLAWMPDGRSFLSVGAGPNGTMVWHRSLDALDATPVSGTDGANSVFVSPDGSRIGIVTVNPFGIRLVPRAGGQPVPLVSEGVSGGGADWADDGYIYFDGAAGLARIRPDGTGREAVIMLDSTRKEVGLAWPQVLPNARGMIYRLRRVGDDLPSYSIEAVDLKTKKRVTVVKAVYARYADPGMLLYVTADGTLWAARFDPDRLALAGGPQRIASGLAMHGFGAVDVAVSRTGSLLYLTGQATPVQQTPVWVSRDGVDKEVDPSWRNIGAVAASISPDGKRLALHMAPILTGETTRSEDIWIKQLDTGPVSRLTFEGEQNRWPVWSPDGRDVLFPSSRQGPSALYRQRADGSRPAERVAERAMGLAEGLESPDGRWILARTPQAFSGDGDILLFDTTKPGPPTPLVTGPFKELAPSLSPDGRWLAYASNETGRLEVYVRPCPDVGGGKVQVSTAGGAVPRWSHAGTELFFVNAASELMVAALARGPSLAVTSQRTLFSVQPYLYSNEHPLYDVAPGDQRFLMLRTASARAAADLRGELIYVGGFTADLAKQLPR